MSILKHIKKAVPPGREQLALQAFLASPHSRKMAERLAAPYSTEGEGSGLAIYQSVVDTIRFDADETEQISFRAAYYLAMILKPKGPVYMSGNPHVPTQMPGPVHVPRVVEGQLPILNPVCLAANAGSTEYPYNKGWRMFFTEHVQSPVPGARYFYDPLSNVCVGVDARGRAFEAKSHLPEFRSPGARCNPNPWIPSPENLSEYQQYLIAPERYMRNRMKLAGWEVSGSSFKHSCFYESAMLCNSFTRVEFIEERY